MVTKNREHSQDLRVYQLFTPQRPKENKFPSRRNEALNDELQTIVAVLSQAQPPPFARQFYKFLTPQYNFTPHKLDTALNSDPILMYLASSLQFLVKSRYQMALLLVYCLSQNVYQISISDINDY